MNDNLIITIGRQFGSGGREIGKRLADLFGIAYYDKELINEASKSSGLSTEYFEKADERAPSALLNSFSINWLTGAGGIWGDGGLSNEYILPGSFKVPGIPWVGHIAGAAGMIH